jgi:hypothetical protein
MPWTYAVMPGRRTFLAVIRPREEDDMGHLERVHEAMQSEGIDALLLGDEGSGYFVAGHTRIGVHPGSAVFPITVVPSSGLPHVMTPDPDGATHMPQDHVHGARWSPATLASDLPGWVGRSSGLRLGVDALSPMAHELIRSTFRDSEIVDATELLVRVMLVKTPEEIEQLAELCQFVTRAAERGLRDGRAAMLEALEGAFPVMSPRVSGSAVRVAVRRHGMVGEARLGPGEPALGERAVKSLAPGATVDEIATEIPPGVEVIGLGWGFDGPVLRDGLGSPARLVLQAGAVLTVRWAQCGVTVAITDDGVRFLSREPHEVAR